MIYFNDLKLKEDYWYIFIPSQSINLQTIKLEKVHLKKFVDDVAILKVYKTDESDNEFLTVTINLDKEPSYPNMFLLNDKDAAELYWAKEFFKYFKDVNGVEFSNFVKLYKRIQVEHPEWII